MASSNEINKWIVLFVVSLCPHVAICECPTGWTLVNPGENQALTCYKIFTTPDLNFDGASTFCKSQGGYLAKETSQVIHDGLKPILNTAAGTEILVAWIGLTDINSIDAKWVWVDGTPLGSYTNFADNVVGVINQRFCVLIIFFHGEYKWYTTSDCNSTAAFICQIDDIVVPPAASTTQMSACPPDWMQVTIGTNQTCYKIFSNPKLSFDNASSYCQNQGGYLARETSQVIHIALKPNVIAAITIQTPRLWIGLTDNNSVDGNWVWVGGPPVGPYINFADVNTVGVTDRRDCVFISVSANEYKWYKTINCNQTCGFICQRDYNMAPPVVTTATTPVPAINCPTGWTLYTNGKSCISLNSNPLTWTAARAFCQQTPGADLIRINGPQIRYFLNGLINANKAVYWIGLSDRAKEGNFTWLDDKNVTTVTNWGTGMPNGTASNENCVVADGFKNSKWDDLPCNKLNAFICQMLPNAGTPPPSTAITPSNKNCGTGWEDVTNADTCVMFNTNVLTWLDAQADCIQKGGDLASITSVLEQYYIAARSLSFAASMFWIGANDRMTESGFYWSDQSAFSFVYWDVGQPDNAVNSDCVMMSQATGRWNDVPCESRNGYICKKKGAVTMTSLVTTTTPPAHLPADKVFGCSRGWDNYRGSCYKVMQAPLGITWADASSSCIGIQGALAAIIDYNENQFVYSLIAKTTNTNNRYDYAWIGMHDTVQEGSFTWSDDTPVTFAYWMYGEPNNQFNQDCVAMVQQNGRWSDVQCTSIYTTYVCKKNKSIQPKNPDDEQGCTNGAIGYGAQCYIYVTPTKNFNDAQKDCRTRSQNQGNLATIDTGDLQAFLSAELATQPGQNYWIGLQQYSDVYKWQSNWPVDFTYWNKNHTGLERNTCVAMQKTGLWANLQCQGNASYICEASRIGYTTASTPTTVTRTLPCPTGWAAYGSLCYRVYAMNMSDYLDWGDARDFCSNQAPGGSLVTISDSALQTFLTTGILKSINGTNATGHFWIGLNDRDFESGYVWQDQSPYFFSNWASGEPDDNLNREDCVEWIMPSNAWYNDYCYVAKNWICQVPVGSIITTPKPVVTVTQSSIITTPKPVVTVTQTGLCGNSSWVQGQDGSCYFISSPDGDLSAATWFDARQICISMGSDLASIGGNDENRFITSLISKIPVDTFWIGMNDLDTDNYGWIDRSPVSYVNWDVNEPNDAFGGERCVDISSAGAWSDNHCQTALGYICKKQIGSMAVSPPMPIFPDGGCPRGFQTLPALSFCYQIGGLTNDTRRNFSDALTACEGMVHKATLASVHNSLEEKYILVSMANLRTAAWIGFTDRRVNNQFQWVDNLPVTYTNWGPGQPDENIHDPQPSARRDCVDVEIGGRAGSWNDRRCSDTLAYICETRKMPTMPTVPPDATGCNGGYQRFRNSCYKFFKDYYNWTQAEHICQSDGGHLATVGNGIEQAFMEILTGHVNDNFQFWIGLQYGEVGSAFHSTDGWPVWYTNWGPNQPYLNGTQGPKCVVTRVDGKWSVTNCTYQFTFICKINLGATIRTPMPVTTIPQTDTISNCPGGWDDYRGSCYLLVQLPFGADWADANVSCSNPGMQSGLVTISDNDENEFVLSLIPGGNYGYAWIGMRSYGRDEFTWVDNTPVEYANWQSSELINTMDDGCVVMLANTGTWELVTCESVYHVFVCEINMGIRPTPGSGDEIIG